MPSPSNLNIRALAGEEVSVEMVWMKGRRGVEL
jgi:hypothetical protein